MALKTGRDTSRHGDRCHICFRESCGGRLQGMHSHFLHPEVSHGLTCDGIPQVNLDQLNPHQMIDPSFCTLAMEA